MTKKENIPQAELPEEVRTAAGLGATSIQCIKQADGNWTIIVTN
jgi:hypothetical protein